MQKNPPRRFGCLVCNSDDSVIKPHKLLSHSLVSDIIDPYVSKVLLDPSEQQQPSTSGAAADALATHEGGGAGRKVSIGGPLMRTACLSCDYARMHFPFSELHGWNYQSTERK